MKSINLSLYRKIEKIASKVFDSLTEQGVAIPSKAIDGSIRFRRYIVSKNNGLYHISNNTGYVLAENINLPHTAILLANKLALTHYLDRDILLVDQSYGYKLFDELAAKSAAKTARQNKDFDRAEFLEYKQQVAAYKKEIIKKKILISFEKLKQSNK